MDVQFFYRNAGYCVKPGETRQQGRWRGARELAKAEQHARERGWTYVWEADPDGCSGCDCGSDDCACSTGEEHETLACVLYSGQPPFRVALASLSGICGATPEYGRVVEAELALEAMANAL